MAKKRNERVQHLPYKGFTICSWSPTANYYAAEVLEGSFRTERGGSRAKVIKWIKDAINQQAAMGRDPK